MPKLSKAILSILVFLALLPLTLAQGVFDDSLQFMFGATDPGGMFVKFGLFIVLFAFILIGLKKVFPPEHANVAVLVAAIISLLGMKFMPEQWVRGLGTMIWVFALILLPYLVVSIFIKETAEGKKPKIFWLFLVGAYALLGFSVAQLQYSSSARHYLSFGNEFIDDIWYHMALFLGDYWWVTLIVAFLVIILVIKLRKKKGGDKVPSEDSEKPKEPKEKLKKLGKGLFWPMKKGWSLAKGLGRGAWWAGGKTKGGLGNLKDNIKDRLTQRKVRKNAQRLGKSQEDAKEAEIAGEKKAKETKEQADKAIRRLGIGLKDAAKVAASIEEEKEMEQKNKEQKEQKEQIRRLGRNIKEKSEVAIEKEKEEELDEARRMAEESKSSRLAGKKIAEARKEQEERRARIKQLQNKMSGEDKDKSLARKMAEESESARLADKKIAEARKEQEERRARIKQLQEKLGTEKEEKKEKEEEDLTEKREEERQGFWARRRAKREEEEERKEKAEEKEEEQVEKHDKLYASSRRLKIKQAKARLQKEKKEKREKKKSEKEKEAKKKYKRPKMLPRKRAKYPAKGLTVTLSRERK